jgi:hypothetical protein
MNRSIVFRIILALVLIGVVAAIGAYAYQAGVAFGMAQNLPAVDGEAFKAPFPYYWMPYRHFYGFGFPGFGFLGCLVPLFLLFLFFGLMRALIWRPHWGHMHHHGPWRRWMGPDSEDAPPFFEEWHRHAHEEKKPEQPAKQ